MGRTASTIYMYDEDGNYVDQFPSFLAVRKYLGVSGGAIYSSLKYHTSIKK